MKRPILPVVLASVLGTACTAHTMFYADPTRFTVTSEPSGATVYAMGEVLGTTPLEIRREQIFPATYPSQLESEYGFVTLEYQGCEPYRKTINNKILEDGLNAALTCPPAAKPATIPMPTETVTPAKQAPPTPPSARQRLLELKGLYDEGLITEREYSERRKAILDGI